MSRSASLGISVIVSGSGVGGLMSALELWRRGCDVRVFEKTAKLVTSGDSFAVGTSALVGLKPWPMMHKRIAEITHRPLVAIHDMTGKRIKGPITEGGGKRMGRQTRPQFHAMLLDQLASVGLQVEYGKGAADYIEDETRGQAGVVLKDGSTHWADLIVAADGVGGASTRLVQGQPVKARQTGDAVIRAAYPVEIAMKDPNIAERFKLTEDGDSIVELWNGQGCFGAFWRTKDQMSVGLQHPDNGTAAESWTNRISHEAILAYTATIKGWPDYANKVIKAIPEDQLMDYKLVWRDPQPKWTSKGGLVVQLGDAAHTLLPTSGNGATQAMEDAVSLATCISLAGTKDRIPQATRVHNLLRFERVSCLQALGVSNRKKLKADPNKGSKDGKITTELGSWIIDHDPEAYANENYSAALEHLETGAEFKNTNTPPGLVYRPWSIDTLLEAQEKGEPTILDSI